jgi:hypothetical protein
MPTTRLILHVKGTQAETAELPKDVVRAAISQGQLTLSQLIWSPAHNTWKQIREIPDLAPSESLILHVKGTESQTRELPKQAVRAAISQGEISHSQLIWRPEENTWKQVRELPELLPSQTLAPAPARAIPRAVDPIIPESPSNPVARAAAATAGIPQPRVASVPTAVPKPKVASSTSSIPHVRVAVPKVGTQQVRAAPTVVAPPKVKVAAAHAVTPIVHAVAPVAANVDRRVKDEDTFHPFKWIFIGLGAIVLLVLGGNYVLVDRPLASSMSQTTFADTSVYAHYGAFMQPNVIVIHIPASAKITPDSFADFLVALAHSTPQSAISRDLFGRVALTSGWTAQYSFSGYGWKELGDMTQDGEAQRKEFIMAQLADAGGQPLMPESTLSEDVQQARRAQVWQTFVSNFAAKP